MAKVSCTVRLLAGLLCLGSTLAMAQTYRWVDPATGKTVYTDTPPPGKAKDVRRTGPAGTSAENLPYGTRRAVENFPVTLYTAADCPEECQKARELLKQRGIPFTEKVVQEEADKEELKTLVGDAFVPSLKVGRQGIKGFAASAYNSALDLAGYPKATGSKPAEAVQ